MRSEAGDGAAAAVRDREHRERGAQRIRERDEDRARADAVQAGQPADGAEDRTCARDEDEPETRAEDEAAAEISCPPARQERKRPLEQLTRAWDDEGDCQHKQQCDRDLRQRGRAQLQRGEDRRGRERERRERRDEPGDDRIRAAPAAASAAREHDRQHRQDAGRQHRDESRTERNREQHEHAPRVFAKFLRGD